MKTIDLESLTNEDLADYKTISEAFKQYLIDELGYDEIDADFVVASDFENPYDTLFINQNYEGVFTVEGKDYEIRHCKTDFCTVGLFHLASGPQFEFYMLFDLAALPNKNVRSYQKAEKKYILIKDN